MKKFLHIQFTGPYTRGMSYQENILPRYQVDDCTQVLFWAPCYAWVDGQIRAVSEEDDILADGVHLIRFPFVRIGNAFLTRKLRYVKNVYPMLEELKPDYIMLHGFQTQSALAITRYVKDHPDVRLVVDSHTDQYNSGRTFLSKYLLHRVYYRFLAKKVARYATKIFYLTEEILDYLFKGYDLARYKEKMAFLPLGGIVYPEEIYCQKRTAKRLELGVEEEDVLIVHSGKMSQKKRTKELLEAVLQISSKRIRVALIGEASEDVQKEIDTIIQNDNRILFLGWKRGDELLEYLCAADIYAQPGTQSATMQNAVCCRCAMILYPYKSHKSLLGDSALYAKSVEEIRDALSMLLVPEVLRKYQKYSRMVGEQLLDYRRLAKIAALEEPNFKLSEA